MCHQRRLLGVDWKQCDTSSLPQVVLYFVLDESVTMFDAAYEVMPVLLSVLNSPLTLL